MFSPGMLCNSRLLQFSPSGSSLVLLETGLQSSFGLPDVLQSTRARYHIHYSRSPQERIHIFDSGQLLSQSGDGGEHSPDIVSPTHSSEIFTNP